MEEYLAKFWPARLLKDGDAYQRAGRELLGLLKRAEVVCYKLSEVARLLLVDDGEERLQRRLRVWGKDAEHQEMHHGLHLPVGPQAAAGHRSFEKRRLTHLGTMPLRSLVWVEAEELHVLEREPARVLPRHRGHPPPPSGHSSPGEARKGKKQIIRWDGKKDEDSAKKMEDDGIGYSKSE